MSQPRIESATELLDAMRVDDAAYLVHKRAEFSLRCKRISLTVRSAAVEVAYERGLLVASNRTGEWRYYRSDIGV